MNKKELVSAVVKNMGSTDGKAAPKNKELSAKEVEVIIERIIEEMSKELQNTAGEVTLAGLGKFSVAQRAARTGRNPQTGATIQIAAKKVVKFTPANALKDGLNPPNLKKV